MNKLFLLVLVAFQVNAQDTIYFPKIDLYKRNIVELSYGIPLGQLANKYENSINSGIYFRTKIAKRQFIDFGFELGGIIKGKTVTYDVNGESIILDGSKSTFLLGLRYTRFLYRSKNDNFNIESNSGIGWKYLHYSKPEEKRFEAVEINPQLNTFVLSQGVKVMFHGIGLHCNYHFSPYGLFDARVERDFGASSINIGLSGSWNF